MNYIATFTGGNYRCEHLNHTHVGGEQETNTHTKYTLTHELISGIIRMVSLDLLVLQ